MKIDKIDVGNKFLNSALSKRNTNPIKSKSTKIVEGVINSTIAAASGMYIVKLNQTKQQEPSIKESLGLNNETIDKLFNATNMKGERVFDKESLEILKNSANLGEKTFYNCIMKNLDGIQYLKKEMVPTALSEPELSYSMLAFTKKGVIKAVALPNSSNYVEIREVSRNEEKITKTQVKDGIITEEIKNYVDDKLVSSEKINTNLNKNTIVRSIYDKDDNQVSHIETVYKDNGVFTNRTEVEILKTKNPSTISNDNKTVINSNNKLLLKRPWQKEKESKKIFTKEGILINKTDDTKKRSKTVDYDYRTGVVNQSSANENFKEILTQTRSYINPKTGRKEIQTLTPSDVNGVFNSTITDDLGNSKVESFGKIDENGNKIVKKDFESFDGTRTQYFYKSNSDNTDIKVKYQIKDKDGKNLMTMDRSFKRVSPDLAYSTINGHLYEIKRDGNNISIKDYVNNKTKNIDIVERSFYQFNSSDLGIYDKLSGDMLIDFIDSNYHYLPAKKREDCGMIPATAMVISYDDVNVFNHELGHVKDYKQDKWGKFTNVISNNPEVLKAYEQERSEFIKNASHLEQENIDYFINKVDHKEGKGANIIETVAEIKSILSTATGEDEIFNGLWSRKYHLQKYFPKTVAAVARCLNPNANLYLEN